jgi:ABC-type lipoprotein release transport system permease subunit
MLLIRIAARNIWATPVRTLIIGVLVVFGTVLVVVGGSLLSTLDGTMAKSVVGSVSGHLQLHSADARDKLDLFNPPSGTPDLGHLDDFPAIKEIVMGVEGVQAVIPMGTDLAMVYSGNILDIRIAELKDALAAGDAPKVRTIAAHIRAIIEMLRAGVGNLEGFARKDALKEDAVVKTADIDRAVSDAFWEDFAMEPDGAIDFLENKVTPLAMDEKMLWLRYIGTDTAAFDEFFEMFEIVKGEMIPPGQRGFLFSDRMYERQAKHTVARRLDRIKELREQDRTIAGDEKTENLVKQNSRQQAEIMVQLDGPATAAVTAKLRDLLGASGDADLKDLLGSFLAMDDDNFDARYAFFYEEIAPHLILYQVRMGDTLTITTLDRSGYLTNVLVKVYGTYKFKGLEKSMLAGVYNVVDLMTFRDLYGYMTEDRREEIEQLQEDAGVARFDRASAEDALFGGGNDDTVENVAAAGFDEFAGIDMSDGGKRYDEELMARVYSQEEIEDGVVIQAAVRLDSLERLDEAKQEIQARLDAAGMNVTVVDWRSASGLVGQFIGVIWAVLVSAILIIFLVALVIINNSMVMATLDRTREIGAMRAMGAQKRYILNMLVIESLVLGLGFGLLGVLLGSGLILILGQVGIPAFTDELYFIFAGPALYPGLKAVHFLLAFGVVLAVVVASVFYPARLAMKVQPVEAMGKED